MSGTSSSASSSTSSGELLEHVAGSPVHQDRVAGADPVLLDARGHQGDPLLVATADHDHAVVGQHLLDADDLALQVLVEHIDDVEGLVQDDLDPGAQPVALDLGIDVHAHLRPPVNTSTEASSFSRR